MCVGARALSNKERPFLRDYSAGAVSQNTENKLESQEGKSFMSDALITQTSRFPQTRISWFIIWSHSSWGQLDTKKSQTIKDSLMNKSPKTEGKTEVDCDTYFWDQ